MRRIATPSTFVAATAVVLALAATAFALAPRNWVTSSGIRNGTITGIDVKNASLRGVDIANRSLSTGDIALRGLYGTNLKNDTVTGTQVKESTLDVVPSASKASGFTRITPSFVAAFDAADAATGRADAPLVPLLAVGSLKLEAKCFHETGADVVHAEVYATTTADGAVMSSAVDDLAGGGTVDATTFLNTASALADRQVLQVTAGSDVARISDPATDSELGAFGIDGTWLRGSLAAMVRNGSPTGAPTTFYGSEHSCAFFGEVAHSGTD